MAEPRKWDMNPWWRGGGKRKYKIRHEIPSRVSNWREIRHAWENNNIIDNRKKASLAKITTAFTNSLRAKRLNAAKRAAEALEDLAQLNSRTEGDAAHEAEYALRARIPSSGSIHPIRTRTANIPLRDQQPYHPLALNSTRRPKRLQVPYRNTNMNNILMEGLVEEELERQNQSLRLQDYRIRTGGIQNPLQQPHPRYIPVPDTRVTPARTWYDYAYGYRTPSGSQGFTPISEEYNLDEEGESKFME